MEAKTIGERAKEFAYQVDYQSHKDDLPEAEQAIRACGVDAGYIKGATDQQDIDIEKAWELFQKYATFTHPRKGTTECVMTKSQFRQQMTGTL